MLSLESVTSQIGTLTSLVLSTFVNGRYDAVLCKPNAYCISKDEIDETTLDSIASFRQRRVVYRLWKQVGDKYLVPRGFGLRLEQIGYAIQPFAPWLEPVLMPIYASYLRDYQQEVLIEVLKQMRKIGSATIEVATGGGKTWIGCAAAVHLATLGAPVIYTAFTTDLVLQFVKVCKAMGARVGIWIGDRKELKSITATTAASLYKAVKNKDGDLYKLFSKVGLFVFDESQHLPARMMITITKNLPHAFIMSMSATPYHTEGLDEVIYAISGDIVPRRVLSSELIDRGYLVPVHIFQVPTPVKMLHGKLKDKKAYHNVKRKVWYSAERARFIGELAKLLARHGLLPIMVYAKEIEHIDFINKVTGNMFIKVSSELDPDLRRIIYEVLCSQEAVGKIYGIAITTTGREGIDIPCLRSIINATAGRSRVEVMQVPGRLTRPWKDKKYGVLIDLVDDVPVYRRQGMERVRLWSREKRWHVHQVSNLYELDIALSSL